MLAEGERVLRASGRLFGKTAHDRVTAGEEYRAMTKQLLEELKGNSSDAQSERSATNKQEG